jgi:hypothetical protein
MRRLLFSVVLALLVAVPAFSEEAALPSDLFSPEPLQTAVCTACGGNYTTAQLVGKGADCAQAQANLTSQLRAAANLYCYTHVGDYPSCSLTVVGSGGCLFILETYEWVTSGYANFKCRYWTGAPGCIIP